MANSLWLCRPQATARGRARSTDPPVAEAHRPVQDASNDNFAWQTLQAHHDDARVPEDLRARIQAGLSPLALLTDQEAFALADEILSYIDHAQAQKEE